MVRGNVDLYAWASIAARTGRLGGAGFWFHNLEDALSPPFSLLSAKIREQFTTDCFLCLLSLFG